MTATYQEFLMQKAQLDGNHGFDPAWLPEWLFGFQAELMEWATRKGRAAVFADCGMGKTPMQLVWAQNVYKHTGRPVLVAAPLAVSFQTEDEAAKFGVEAAVSRDGSIRAPVTVTNYERLHLFAPADFGGTVCDESSAIKAFDGVRRAMVTEFLRQQRYRLLCTATAAPNDYIELGTSSEALGYLGHMDMLSRFFTNNGKGRMWGRDGAWRFKGHAEEPFWRWVASWARALRRPSDLGFPDTGFELPELVERQHVQAAVAPPDDGTLFPVPAAGLREAQAEQRRTIAERCEKAAELASAHDISVLWCNLNDEGDELERLIPNSLQVCGSDSSDFKEKAARWFVGSLCICNEPEFGAKLAAWHKGPRGTGSSTTRSTESNAWLNHWITSNATARSDATTCVSTPGETRRSSGALPASGPSTTDGGASGTRPTPRTANEPSSRPRPETPPSNATHDSDGSSASEPPSSTGCSPSKAEGAPSATVSSATGAATNLPLTTTMHPVRYADSYAPPATSGSGSSATVPSCWTAPGCICGHVSGTRRLISKSSIFGFGLNFQHCSHVVYFPSYSYEQYYQAVRRCWRYGQQHPVVVDIVSTEGGADALASLQRKAAQADRMFDALVAHMRDAVSVRRSASFDRDLEVPAWL